MSYGSCLSDKALCRFRTKPCERLLATGSCSFKDKCQYSHDDWLRRNPSKVAYEAELCPNLSNCQAGRKCGFAHSQEEVLYHPRRYKTSRCYASGCRGYYCPYAHYPHERREPKAAVVCPPMPSPDEEEDEVPSDVLPFDEMLHLDAADWRTKGGAATLLRGCVKLRAGEWRRCCVRLASYGREERGEVDTLVRELKVWMRVNPEALLAVRRSVASVALALPESEPALGVGAEQPGREQAVTLLRQISTNLVALHEAGIAHTCISPSSVAVMQNGSFTCRLGDFLPKLRAMMALKRGWSEKDGAFADWAAWQPPEMQQASKTPVVAEGTLGGREIAKARGIDLFKVDAWQLGAVAATALLGGHPYGDSPDEICQNIAANQPVRLDESDAADTELVLLLRKLLCPDPKNRLRVQDVASDAALREAVPSESSSCISDEAFSVGTTVSCAWEGGVRLRPRRVRNLCGQERLEKGDTARVRDRRGGWIRLEGGWAPLRGVGDAAGCHLFEVTDLTPTSTATTADTCAEPLPPDMPPSTPPHVEASAGPACWPPNSDKWSQVEWQAFWSGFHDASRVELKLPAPPTPGIPQLPAKVYGCTTSCEIFTVDDDRYWIQEGFVWL